MELMKSLGFMSYNFLMRPSLDTKWAKCQVGKHLWLPQIVCHKSWGSTKLSCHFLILRLWQCQSFSKISFLIIIEVSSILCLKFSNTRTCLLLLGSLSCLQSSFPFKSPNANCMLLTVCRLSVALVNCSTVPSLSWTILVFLFCMALYSETAADVSLWWFCPCLVLGFGKYSFKGGCWYFSGSIVISLRASIQLWCHIVRSIAEIVWLHYALHLLSMICQAA